ncbi:YfiT family bacillithiol transferase [Dinghuibacter silviterrae]|uniref:DinB family protein n=1 Tax=Dinghuibacter silviterrae TaxID=1539049 RepID=A0A4R8DSD2_9BACT|nr:bacillithiol transferase BstA [Dinghuibacter silviterrae]TDX01120.1 DinB family protein [Dinghuibacter silviterrae]
MNDPRYPIGKYEPQPYSDRQRDNWIADIRFLPTLLEKTVSPLDAAQLGTPYREGGWTVQQLVHHVADSHLNAYTRFKLGLTEDTPTIRPYDEKAWAQLADTALPINLSLTLLHALHARWVAVLESITDWNREVVHPETGKHLSLWTLLGMYAWHGKHHVAHITSLIEAKGW